MDGETWKPDGEKREENLRDLSGRLARGAYRARPVRRVDIEKADGRQRPLGVPVREDQMVQGAAGEVRNAIYEVGTSSDFATDSGRGGAPIRRWMRWHVESGRNG